VLQFFVQVKFQNSLKSPMSKISIVCPVCNEKDNLEELVMRIFAVLASYESPSDMELILVDDASTDESLFAMYDLAARFCNITVVCHRKRLGQGVALSSGFRVAKGDVVITMDADLQVFPEDIPFFIAKIKEGYDLVNGIRVRRKEKLFFRVCSKIFTLLVNVTFGVSLRDAASNFTAVKKDFVKNLTFVANDHRFIVPILHRRGALRIAEVNIRHSTRNKGKSKYSLFKPIIAVPEFVAFYFRLKSGFYDLSREMVG